MECAHNALEYRGRGWWIVTVYINQDHRSREWLIKKPRRPTGVKAVREGRGGGRL